MIRIGILYLIKFYLILLLYLRNKISFISIFTILSRLFDIAFPATFKEHFLPVAGRERVRRKAIRKAIYHKLTFKSSFKRFLFIKFNLPVNRHI